MSKIIIKNKTSLSDAKALGYVGEIIHMGLVSKTSKGPQYCFATTFKTGYVIYSDKTRRGSYVFTVLADKE